jgi:uncharacterized protein (TIGR03435 family)
MIAIRRTGPTRRSPGLFLFIFSICVIAGNCQSIDSVGPAFDVASVKQNKSSMKGSHIYNPNSGSFRAVNVSLKDLLQFVYGLQEEQLVGIPSDVSSATFDIDAKMDSDSDARLAKLDKLSLDNLKKDMLRTVLAERFQLKSHRETRKLPVFVLVTAKNGPKLLPANDKGLKMGGTSSSITSTGVSVDQLSGQLALRLERPVLNQTGISGQFDVVIQWDPDVGSPGNSSSSLPSSIFSAIDEQLGLKLESRKEEVDVLVIDQVQMPTLN